MTDIPAVDGDFRMTLSEHLGELRTRLIRCVLAIVVFGGGSLFFARDIFGILMRPVLESLPPATAQLVYTSAIEEINVYMKVGLYSGIFLTTPVILWQVWGFVAPGLYKPERRLAAPFVILGTVAFVAGALFCYFMLLPTMFQFLLREENTVEAENTMVIARAREDEAMRLVRMGDLEAASQLSKKVSESLEGKSRVQPEHGDLGLTLAAAPETELVASLDAMGRMIDAAMVGADPVMREALRRSVDARVTAIEALEHSDLTVVRKSLNDAASTLVSIPGSGSFLGNVWSMERSLAASHARLQAMNWTRPMLSMSEQLTLVLVLELALGVIFELPLVMALLGLVGLVKSKWLFKYQRHALVVCLIVAAIVTPTGDAVNLSLMAGPMLLCYEFGTLAVWLIEKRRAARETAITPVE